MQSSLEAADCAQSTAGFHRPGPRSVPAAFQFLSNMGGSAEGPRASALPLTWFRRGQRGWKASALASSEVGSRSGVGAAWCEAGVAGEAAVALSLPGVAGVAALTRTSARQYWGRTGGGGAPVAAVCRHSSKLPSWYWLPRSRSWPDLAVESTTAKSFRLSYTQVRLSPRSGCTNREAGIKEQT